MNIPEIEELLAKITPGEWSCEMNILYGPNDDGTGISMDNTDDAIFIAAAPRMIRQLLAQVKEQEPNIQFLVNKIADLQAQLSHTQGDLDSDSIIASCNCGTKTPDTEHHKKGCKYRILIERDSLAVSARILEDQLSRTQKAGEELAMLSRHSESCELSFMRCGKCYCDLAEALQNWNALQKGEQK